MTYVYIFILGLLGLLGFGTLHYYGDYKAAIQTCNTERTKDALTATQAVDAAVSADQARNAVIEDALKAGLSAITLDNQHQMASQQQKAVALATQLQEALDANRPWDIGLVPQPVADGVCASLCTKPTGPSPSAPSAASNAH